MEGFEKCRNKKYVRDYRENQWKLDPEKAIHTPEHYAVWNLKHYFLKDVMKRNPYKSELFIFTDSGAWRGKQFNKWPDQEFVKKVADKIGDRILYGQVRSNPDLSHFNIEDDIIQGIYLYKII